MTPAFWTPGPLELVIIALVALIIFGRRLPEVARSIGKSIVEFKRGIRDVEDDIDTQSKLDDERCGRSRLEDSSRDQREPSSTTSDRSRESSRDEQ